MMVDLRDGLRSLAEELSVDAGDPPEALWRLGRRRQIIRGLGGAVVGVLVLLVAAGASLVSWPRPDDVSEPAPPSRSLTLPDRFYTPSRWLDGTDDSGPIGPLVAVIGAERASWHGWGVGAVNGLAGVSTSGEYRFLDLPGYTGQVDYGYENGRVALSPDGRYLAYWRTGPTTADPFRSAPGQPPLGAAAVYDTVTGDVITQRIKSEHGIASWGIAWAGPVVRFGYGGYAKGGLDRDSSSSQWAGQVIWDGRTDSWETVTDLKSVPDVDVVAQGPDAFVSVGAGYAIVGADGVEAHFRLARQVAEDTPFLNPSRSSVAGVLDPEPSVTDGKARPLVVGDLSGVTETGRVPMAEIPGFAAQSVVGWRDDDHVVAQRWQDPRGYFSVDVQTGQSERVSISPVQVWEPGLAVAAEAWAEPTTHVAEPEWPWDPRVKAGLWAAAASAVLLMLWVRWRRRAAR